MGPGVGIFSNLGVGITILQGQFTWAPQHGYKLLWKEVCSISCAFVSCCYRLHGITG